MCGLGCTEAAGLGSPEAFFHLNEFPQTQCDLLQKANSLCASREGKPLSRTCTAQKRATVSQCPATNQVVIDRGGDVTAWLTM